MNKLKINIKKKTLSLNINYNNQSENISVTKYLGLNIQIYNTNWKPHTESLCKRVNSFIFVLNKISKISDLKTAILAYHAYINSILRYGIIFWGNSTNNSPAS
jgi:catabolite regulation protein CreA